MLFGPNHEFVVMPDRTGDAVLAIMDAVPAFRETLDQDDLESPYLVAGQLAIWLESQDDSNPAVQRAFEVMNRLAEWNDSIVDDLLVVGIFETLIDSPQTLDWARQRLSDRVLSLFQDVEKAWE